MENKAFFDVFADMTISELRVAYNKTDGAVRKGIERMLKELDNPELRYRNEKGEFTIKAAGVEWLDNYFIKNNEISTDPAYIRMEERIKYLEETLKNEKENRELLKTTLENGFLERLELIEENKAKDLLLQEKSHTEAQNALKNENIALKFELEKAAARIEALEKRTFWDYLKKK